MTNYIKFGKARCMNHTTSSNDYDAVKLYIFYGRLEPKISTEGFVNPALSTVAHIFCLL